MIETRKFKQHQCGMTTTPCIESDINLKIVGGALRYLAADPLERWVAKIEHRARQILLDAGHDPDKPGLFPEPLEQGGLLYDSHILLRHLNIFKSEIICDANAAVRRAIKIEGIAGTHDLLVDHGEEIRRGRQFINGPRSKKKDKLAREIMTGLEKIGRKASANQLLTFVRKNQNFEVEGDKSIHWTSDRGAPKTTTFKAFQNRISELRRRI